jgi:hypothetical protein
MKVGDLVKHKYGTVHGHGMVVEPPDSTLCEATVLWMTGQVMALSAGWLEVISETR